VAVKVAEVQNMARLVLKDRTGAVALRAELESGERLRRGKEVSKQAKIANPKNCRDSLQSQCPPASRLSFEDAGADCKA
jgi:hypothetical protein